ncbi:hypothetical protein L7F22_056935 [Adiantum nelumboides]|nr:hypothetical protein [Adiantum nelumboides]
MFGGCRTGEDCTGISSETCKTQFYMAAYLQLVSPWDLKYHAYFMGEMSSVSVVIADVVEAFVYASLTWGLLSSQVRHHHRLWVSFGAGFGPAVFWVYYIKRLSRMHWDLLWLPLGPCRFLERECFFHGFLNSWFRLIS